MKTRIHNLGIAPLVRDCQCAIIKVLPTSLSYSTRVFASLKPNCGSKGAAILHNWLPSCNSILWAAGSGCPFFLWVSRPQNDYDKRQEQVLYRRGYITGNPVYPMGQGEFSLGRLL